MNTSPIVQINLVPQTMQMNRVRTRCALRWVCVASATIAFVGLPGVYIGGNAALSDPAIASQIALVNTQFKANESAIPLIEAQRKGLEARLEVLELVENRIDWRQVFARLVDASGDEVRFTGIRAQGGGIEGDKGINIWIDGIATSQTAARSYIVSLEALGAFDQVELTRTTRRDVNDVEVIEFQIIASVTSRGGFNGAQP